MELSVQVSGFDDVLSGLDTASRDVKTATAIGLTRVAAKGRGAVREAMRSQFDRPTPWTLRSIGMVAATREKLEATVELQDEEPGKGGNYREVLQHQFVGGLRAYKRFERAMQRNGLLPNGMVAVPSKGWRTDPYGNIPPSRIVQILAYFDQFGEQGYTANMGEVGRVKYRKRNALQLFVAQKYRNKTRHLARGIWARSVDRQPSEIAPVFFFGSPRGYRKRIDLPLVVIAEVERGGLAIMSRAFGERIGLKY